MHLTQPLGVRSRWILCEINATLVHIATSRWTVIREILSKKKKKLELIFSWNKAQGL